MMKNVKTGLPKDLLVIIWGKSEPITCRPIAILINKIPRMGTILEKYCENKP